MKLIAFYFLLLVPAYAFPQQYVWKRFGISEGVPNTITAIAQSPDGTMWFGSQSGLYVFNGTSFNMIPVAKGVVQPYIQALLSGKNGQVWIGSRDGLWLYDAAAKTMSKQVFHGSSVQDLAWDRDSAVLYAATNDGICEVLAGTRPVVTGKKLGRGQMIRIARIGDFIYAVSNALLRFYPHGSRCDTLSRMPAAYGFAWCARQKTMIYAGKTGVITIDPSGTVKEWNVPFNPVQLAQEQPVFCDHAGRIWFNTHDTLYCFNHPGDKDPFRHTWQNNNVFSPVSVVNRLFSDKDGNVWLASGGGGISMLDSRVGKILFFPSAQLSSTHVWSVLHDPKENSILFGTNNNVAIYGLRSRKVKILPAPPAARRFTVTGMVDFNDRYWYVCTYGNGLVSLSRQTHRFTVAKNFDPSYNVEAIRRTGTGELLVCSESGLFLYNEKEAVRRIPADSPFVQSILCAEQRQNGTYWFGTSEGILVTSRWKQAAHYNSTTGGRLNVVFGILETKDQKLFAVNMSGGLHELNERTGLFSRVELAGESTIGYCIKEVDDSLLAVTTNKGLVLYNHRSGGSRVLNRNNGLPFNEFDQFGCFIDRDYLVAAGPEGAIVINRADLLSLFTDRVSLGIKYLGRVVRSVTIPAGQQSLSAHAFIGNKQANHTLVYEYRLKGLEEEWHRIGRDNEIAYNYLPPGDYTLVLRASDPNRVVQTAEITLPVHVAARWYQTTWFRLLLFAACAGLLVAAVRYLSWLRLRWKLRKLEAEQKVANERIRISRELHDNVGSQLTYLITGLEASEMMLKQHKTEMLNSNLDQLQQSARDSMQQLRDAIWALNKEEMTVSQLAERFRDWVHKMLALQQTVLRFETDISRDVTMDAIKALNLFRLLQEAVHNVIKHAEAMEICITILNSNGMVTCEVRDNGKGFDTGGTAGSGTGIMRARAAELGAEVMISSVAGQGTTVTVRVPLNTLNG